MPEEARRLLTWIDIEQLCQQLAQALPEAGFDAILAVARGGLVPAALLCQSLNERRVLAASVASYLDAERQSALRFLEFPPDAEIAGRRVLVVDDIWDTGRTAVKVRSRLLDAGAEPFIAVLHYKPGSSRFPDQAPDLWAEETADWIVYPWELAGAGDQAERHKAENVEPESSGA